MVQSDSLQFFGEMVQETVASAPVPTGIISRGDECGENKQRLLASPEPQRDLPIEEDNRLAHPNPPCLEKSQFGVESPTRTIIP